MKHVAHCGRDDFAAFTEGVCHHFDYAVGPQFEPSRIKLLAAPVCRIASSKLGKGG